MSAKKEKDKNVLIKAKDAVINALDKNGDGQFDIQDVIIMALKTPGVHITRAKFLQNELFKNHPQYIIDKAIATNPAQAGISANEIDKIADNVIKLERIQVSGISAALGVPGGAATVATTPADIIQYYGYMLRAAQKLLYLYGFPEIGCDDEGLMLDSETIHQLIICLGIMAGVAGADNFIKGMAHAFSKGVKNKILKSDIAKGAIYPLVVKISEWFAVKMTKEKYADFFKNAIPVVGGVIGGGVTFFSFKPCCYRLKNVLQDTMLSNPDHYSSVEEDEIASTILNETIIDVDYESVITDSDNYDE